MITLTVLFLATLLLAYSNGTNDNFKGVAMLFGSGTTSYSSAITWATISTLAGSITSFFLAETLLKNFSGRGIVPNELAASPQFVLAVGLGAGLTVMLAASSLVILASRFGLPVSTTHVSVGSLFGIGLITGEVNRRVVSGILMSWLLTLPIAAIISAGVYAVTVRSS
jgi:PiT family inorganic phosphate transporter